MSRVAWLKALVHVSALMPLALLLWDFSQGRLTADPVREIQLRTGRYALNLLLLTLACTPASTVFKLRQARQLRRPLGLYAFGYASLHLLNFIGLDYALDFGLLWEDFGGKRFIVAGLATLLLLVPLAVTSTDASRTRLGSKSWERMHRLVYIAALLAAVHFLWLTKADFRLPLLYGAVVVALLVLRLPGIRRMAVFRWK